MSSAAIIPALMGIPGAKESGGQHIAKCPAHEDAQASLSWTLGDEGRVLVKCFAGCSAEDIVAALGHEMHDLFEPREHAQATEVRKTEYEARTVADDLVAIHQRVDMSDGTKRISWHRPDGTAGLNGTPVNELPLWGTERAPNWPDGSVVITEGEKAATAVQGAGKAVLASYGAEHRPTAEALEVLRGREVILWPDNDEPGVRHMTDMAERLDGIAAELKWITPTGGKGDDAADELGLAEDPRAALLEVAKRIVPVPVANEPAVSAPEEKPDDTTSAGAWVLSDVPTAAPPERRFGRWDTGHNILYGRGGVGKGLLVASEIVRLTNDGERVMVIDYEDHPDEWSRRVQALDGDRSAVLHVAPLDPERWKGKTGALWEVAPRLRALADDFGATWTIIDSITPACFGADVIAAGTPHQYGGGVSIIGRPTISIGQINRAGDLAYPFGSVHWHYQIRASWSIETPPGGLRGTNLLLTDRKANNYAMAERMQADVTWWDDLPRELSERPYHLAVADRIDIILGDRSMTAADVTAALNEDAEVEADKTSQPTVRKTLKRGITQRYTVTGTGRNALWSKK
jgi:hypothetical protein